jgi:glycosyltransferase involved in cell wall biosynthesis
MTALQGGIKEGPIQARKTAFASASDNFQMGEPRTARETGGFVRLAQNFRILNVGEIARILKSSGTGVAVREGDGKALAHAIMTLAEDTGLAAALGKKARALYESKFDFPIAVSAWEQILANVQTEAQVPRG